MALKKITKITNKQIAEKGVQALADRPNLTAQYGASGLSAAQLKLWFDKLATFLAERINEIVDTISSNEAANYIRVCLDEYGVESFGDLVTAFADGDFAGKILQVFPSAGAKEKQALQNVINMFARDLSVLQEKISMHNSISEWDSTVTYKNGDIVYRDGNIYLCIADEADGDPPETLIGDSWEVLGGGSVAQNGDLSIIATFNITEADTTIALQNLIGMTSIDWGEGTTDNNLTHTYTAVGEYTAKFYGVTSIGSRAFAFVSYLISVAIKNNVTSIEKHSFSNCGSLTSIKIGDGVTSIGESAFEYCGSLTSIKIGDGVTSIDNWAFCACENLTSIKIPASVISLGRGVFTACSSLKTIEINAPTPPTLGINVFYETALTRIVVLFESLEAYKTAEGWRDYATLICSYVYTTDRNKFVKEGITQNTETLTDDEKASACGWLGAVRKLPVSNSFSYAYIAEQDGVKIRRIGSMDAASGTIVARDANGCIKTATPKASGDSANKDYVDNKFDIIDSVLSQSGISYQADIVDAYTERITADGENVLDGSKAVLKKVVGSTVACKQLFDIDSLVYTSNLVTNANGKLIFDNSTASGANYFATESVTAIKLKPNTTYTSRCKFKATLVNSGGISGGTMSRALRLQTNNNYDTNSILIFGDIKEYSGGEYLESVIYNKFTTPDDLSKYKYLVTRSTGYSIKEFSELILVEGEYTESNFPEYQPYFTDLKSASFGGIESTNADGTETSTLAFPKTETPLGTTIDFENKKITEYGVEIDGDHPNIGYSSDSKLFTFIGLNASLADRNYSVSSHYTYDANGSSVKDGTFWITSDGADLRIRDSRFTSVDELRAFFRDNNVTIRYISTTLQSETDITADNEYTAYKGGTEKVLENDGAEYCADNTLTQNYLFVKEVK